MEQHQAITILSQLGGSRFLAMTGAKNFVCGDGLNFSIPRHNGINKVIIKLNWRDTYDLEFYYIRGISAKLIAEDKDIYAENLRETFTARTGLDCTL